MPSFLSAEQVEMLRDELGRLQCPNDQDQIAALRVMSDALDNSDEAAFKAAWRRLKVGYGPRIGVCDEQIPQRYGGSAKPPDPEELTTEAANVLRDLMEGLDGIAPKANDAGAPGAATMNADD